METLSITHTRAEGTLLAGSRKGDGVLEAVRPYGFRWFPSIGEIGITRSRDKAAQTWRINGARAALEQAGHTVAVTIDDSDRRSFAEAEADRAERAEARADRYSGRADNAAAASAAHRKAVDRITDGIPFGQPILVGHHSEKRARRDAERIDSGLHKMVAESDRSSYWAGRAEAAGHYEQHRNNPMRTLRRLERLRADLRQQERHRAETAGGPAEERHVNNIRDLEDEIAHWGALIERAKADGVKVWGPDDFAPGDFVRSRGSWYEIARVNAKTLSIAWNLRLAPKQVVTCQDATFDGVVQTFPSDYTDAVARCPAKAMRAFLADGLVPGLKAAREASAAQPASQVREEQAAAKKAAPKKRSDPKVPRKVRVDCGADGAEGTLTWLNGRGAPHPQHRPVTLRPDDGKTYSVSMWGPVLTGDAENLLKERGFERHGRWGYTRGDESLGLVCKIQPAQVASPAADDEQGDQS